MTDALEDARAHDERNIMTESTLPIRTRIWHAAYARWYDHLMKKHEVRAFIWGVIADVLCPRGAKEWNQ